MTKLRHLLVLLTVLFLAANPLYGQSESAITVRDLLNVRQIDAVEISPSGRYAAHVVTRAEEDLSAPEARYYYRSRIYLAPIGGAEDAYPITRSDEDASQPAWHPDGDYLAFVRPVDGLPQVFVLPLDGGEAFQLTKEPFGAETPLWSPDGSSMLYASVLPDSVLRRQQSRGPSWDDERPSGSRRGSLSASPTGTLPQIQAWLDANARRQDPLVTTRLNIQGETDAAFDLAYRQLFVIDAKEGAASRQITGGFYAHEGGTWADGGEKVIFSANRDAKQHPDRVQARDLFSVDVASGAVQRVLHLDDYILSDPLGSPDGSAVAFRARRIDSLGFAETELGVLDLSAGLPFHWLTDGFDRSVGSVRWSANGWHLYFTAASDGAVPLYRVNVYDVPEPTAGTLDRTVAAAMDSAVADLDHIRQLDLPADSTLPVLEDATIEFATLEDTLGTESPYLIEQLTDLSGGVTSFDVSAGRVVYVRTDPTNPFELYAADARLTSPRRITTHNASWLADRRLSTPKAFSLRLDSLQIPYWIMPPTGLVEGTTYPLLLEIHGGPAAMWGPGEATMWLEFQLFAARGFGIVFANPRGSGGYGQAFRQANYQDWGTGPAADVLAAVDAASRLSWVDPERLAVTGGSYGGYLTAWIIAHDHRFRAAVAQRGVYDLPTFFGEGNAWRLVPQQFGGFPWERSVAGVLDEVPADTAAVFSLPQPQPSESAELDSVGITPNFDEATAEVLPLTQAEEPAVRRSPWEILLQNSPITYVDSIRTPLLIIHGARDYRTGIAQSEMLYRSLKVLGRPVEYARYPDAGHELSRSGDPLQRMDRLLRIYEFIARNIE